VRFTLSGLRAAPTPNPSSGNDVIGSPATVDGKLVSSSPADGATLRFLPEVAVLNFNQLVRLPATLTVTGPDRDEISTADASVQDATLFRPLDGTAPQDGTYLMHYQVTAAGGQSISGTVRFTLSRLPVATTADLSSNADSSSETRSAAMPVAGLIVGLVMALGLAVFTIWRWRRHELVVASAPPSEHTRRP
jgi:copper resistance protein C